MPILVFQPQLSRQERTNIPTWISRTYLNTYAWIMLIHLQTCLLSDFITSGNTELLFRSHNAIDLLRGQECFRARLGRHGTFKSRALRSVGDGKGLMKLEDSRQIFEKYSNIKFHENPSSESRAAPYGRTDMIKLIVASRNFAKSA